MPPPSQTLQHRVALCIGNAKYSRSPLANPVNDATDLADYLHSQLSFQVDVVCNADKCTMLSTFRRFVSRIQPGSVVVLSFHGHGCEVDGVNYLVPVEDMDDLTDADIRADCVSAQWMQEKVAERKPAFLLYILDACRSNPFSKTRSGGGGLAQMEPLGSLLLYATAPGQVALDSIGGRSRNSPLVTHLMQHLHEGEVHSALRKVIKAVHASTNERQKPWHHSDMTDDFHLGRTEASAAQPLSPSIAQQQPAPAVGAAPIHSVSGLSSPAGPSSVKATSPKPTTITPDNARLLLEQAVCAELQRRWSASSLDSVLLLLNQHQAVAVVQVQAMRMFLSAVPYEDWRSRLASYGAIDSITAAMRRHPEERSLQRLGCDLVLWFTDDKQRCERIASAGGIEAVVDAMRRHPFDEDLQQFATNALTAMAAHSSIRKRIVAVSGIDCATDKHASGCLLM